MLIFFIFDLESRIKAINDGDDIDDHDDNGDDGE